MKQNSIGLNLELIEATLAQVAGDLSFIRAVGGLDVKDQFVKLQRIVIYLSQFDLPGADMGGIVEDVLQLIEVHQSALEFFQVHLLNLGTARDIAEQSWKAPATMRTGFIGEAAIRVVSGAIAQDDRAAGVEWSENQFA